MAMDITIRNLQTKVPIRIPRINRAARLAFKHLAIGGASLSIVFVTPQRMKTLNSKYLKHNYVTDILTFNYSENIPGPLLAEIIICPSVAVSNSEIFSTTVGRELELYVVHGILHLAGYDDHSPRDIKRMRMKEQQIITLITHQ